MKGDLTPENLPKPQQREKPESVRERTDKVEAALADEEMQRAMEFLRQEQNLLIGAMAGFLAAVLGAVVWAGVTVTAGYSVGWLAIAVGLVTGLAVRLGGKGIDRVFGVLGAIMSAIGCALGNIFAIAWYFSIETGTPVVDVLGGMDIPIVIEIVVESFEIADILFYAMAVYFGYRYSFRELTQEDFDRALGRAMLS